MGVGWEEVYVACLVSEYVARCIAQVLQHMISSSGGHSLAGDPLSWDKHELSLDAVYGYVHACDESWIAVRGWIMAIMDGWRAFECASALA